MRKDDAILVGLIVLAALGLGGLIWIADIFKGNLLTWAIFSLCVAALVSFTVGIVIVLFSPRIEQPSG